MSTLAQLFGSNFRGTIQQYCARQGWKIADLNDVRAILRFDMASQRTQTCYVIKYDKTLEFSVPSMFSFRSIDQVPHYVSTLLLKRSSEKKIGFWCLEEIAGQQVYSCMHNAELELIDSTYFASVVRVLINECDELETVILKMIR